MTGYHRLVRRIPQMVAVLVVAGMAAGCVNRPPDPARNLLLVTLDTLRADHLGSYGYTRPTSPALDAFAAGSVVFEDATCSMPTTGKTRAKCSSMRA